jgi:hypothetical protein
VRRDKGELQGRIFPSIQGEIHEGQNGKWNTSRKHSRCDPCNEVMDVKIHAPMDHGG